MGKIMVALVALGLYGCAATNYLDREYDIPEAIRTSVEKEGYSYNIIDNKGKSKLLVSASMGRALGHAWVKGASLFIADIGGDEKEYRGVVDDYLLRDRKGCATDATPGKVIADPYWEFSYKCETVGGIK